MAYAREELTEVGDIRTPLLVNGDPSDGDDDADAAGHAVGADDKASLSPEDTSRWGKFRSGLRTFLSFLGPGSMIAVGYMDPGNWATDIAAGSKFGYELLMVVLLSSATAVFVQRLSLRLGIATGRDLAQQCGTYFSRPVVWALFVLAQLAIIATDLAEVIGSAIALQLLFNLDLVWGVLVSAAAVLILLVATSKHFYLLEYLILGLVLTIFCCFIYMLDVSNVVFADMLFGYLPKGLLATNVEALYLAIGIIGATVMPHNLYLHSGISRDHAVGRDVTTALKFSTIDICVSLTFAFIVNSSILAVAAANFFLNGQTDVADIQDAYDLIKEYISPAAATVFAVALLLSGQSSTVTGTVAGQIVAEGFINWRLTPWIRALITRLVAIVPALVVAIVVGDDGVNELLVLSQVILSFQLPFAVFPLVFFTSSEAIMHEHVNGRVIRFIGYLIATVLACLNVYLLIQVFLPE